MTEFIGQCGFFSPQFGSNVFLDDLTLLLYSLAVKETLSEVKTVSSIALMGIYCLRSLKKLVEEGRSIPDHLSA